jgi:ribonuclease P protein component
VVSTKVAKAAVIRNRIKRRLRHLVAGELSTIPNHRDIIIQYHGGAHVPAAELKRAVTNALAVVRNRA